MKMVKDSIQNIIDNSGNKFQCDVIDFLRKRGWIVLVSPFYTDSITDKPREIDIIAEKVFDVVDPYSKACGYVNVKFIIECKYINREVVFWFDDKDMTKAEERVLNDAPFLDPIAKNMDAKKHHYLKYEKVAKLFASDSDKQKQYETEIFFKALSQCLNAMLFYRGRASILPDQRKECFASICYPIILCSSFDNLYRVEIGHDSSSQIQDDFRLEINYAYLNQQNFRINEYFLIDVIGFDKFENYIKELEQMDIEIMIEKLLWDNRNNGY